MLRCVHEVKLRNVGSRLLGRKGFVECTDRMHVEIVAEERDDLALRVPSVQKVSHLNRPVSMQITGCSGS